MMASSHIQHFIHPHLLHKVSVPAAFNCNGCNTFGSGISYRCSACDFDLHEECVNAPSTNFSHHHPKHRLTLTNRSGKTIVCYVCGEKVNGFSYTCPPCDFDVHPLCIQSPMVSYSPNPYHNHHQQPHHGSAKIQHFTHPHLLYELSVPFRFNCNGCNTPGSGISYRCSDCDFDLHDTCAIAPSTISSPHHPQHHLTLVNRLGKAIACDVCGEKVNGLSYTCTPCDFDVHPLCTKIPVQEHNHHHQYYDKHQHHQQPPQYHQQQLHQGSSNIGSTVVKIAGRIILSTVTGGIL